GRAPPMIPRAPAVILLAIVLGSCTHAEPRTEPTVPATGVSGITCQGHPATIVGTPGDDIIVGTSAPDVIAGLGGNDVILGERGNDIICGGPGDDSLFGWPVRGGATC